MTSTNDGKEVKSIQNSGQKGKSYYIDLYKLLENNLNTECDLHTQTQHLSDAWHNIHSLCVHSASKTHIHLLSWLQRHTAKTVIQTEWQSPKSKNEHTLLEDALKKFIEETENAIAQRNGEPHSWEIELLQRAQWFIRLLENPWGHPVLRVLLDPQGTPPNTDDVLEWLKEERGVMFVTRLHQLAASKCDDLALALASAIMDKVRATTDVIPDVEQVESSGNTEKSESEMCSIFKTLVSECGFTVDLWELIVDIEFLLLHKLNRSDRCIELAKLTPLRNGYKLVERLRTRLEKAPREKKLWKNAKEVATLIAQVVIARCMVLPECLGAGQAALFRCAYVLAHLLPAPRLRTAAAALAAPAASARHLHELANALAHALKQRPREPTEPTQPGQQPLVCELYVRAITAGMNELERLKLDPDKVVETRLMEKTLAGWFISLGSALSARARLENECTLTAFSMHPSQFMFDRIRSAATTTAEALTTLIQDTKEEKVDSQAPSSDFGSWANDSRQQTNLVKTSDYLNMKQAMGQQNILSTAILTEGEALGLSPELCQDLTVLLSGPRLKTLSWDMKREHLLENARLYMERTLDGTKGVTTELKYLNLDPKEFQHLPEEDDNENDMYYGIQKGYEHLIETQEDEKQIWQEDFRDGFDQDSDTSESSVISAEAVWERKSRKSKAVCSEDEDPLRTTGVTIRNANRKQQSNSVQRSRSKNSVSRERKQKSVDRLKVDKINDTKKTKKRRKKREKLIAEKTETISKIAAQKISRPKNNSDKEQRITELNFVSITDSDYDSQGKSSLASFNSEGNDPDVHFDGLFSMDDMQSPKIKNSTKTIHSAQGENIKRQNTELRLPNIQKLIIQANLKIKRDLEKNVEFVNTNKVIDKSSNKGFNITTPNIKEEARTSVAKMLQMRKKKKEELALCETKHKFQDDILKHNISSSATDFTKIIHNNTAQSFKPLQKAIIYPNHTAIDVKEKIKETPHQKSYQDFLKKLEKPICGMSEMRESNVGSHKNQKCKIAPENNSNKTLLIENSSPKGAKSKGHTKNIDECSLNTFSRRSYIHKSNKKSKQVVVSTIDETKKEVEKTIITTSANESHKKMITNNKSFLQNIESGMPKHEIPSTITCHDTLYNTQHIDYFKNRHNLESLQRQKSLLNANSRQPIKRLENSTEFEPMSSICSPESLSYSKNNSKDLKHQLTTCILNNTSYNNEDKNKKSQKNAKSKVVYEPILLNNKIKLSNNTFSSTKCQPHNKPTSEKRDITNTFLEQSSSCPSVNNNIMIKKEQVYPKSKTNTDSWEVVMKNLLSLKTPSRGTTLDEILKNENSVTETLRNQRIVKSKNTLNNHKILLTKDKMHLKNDLIDVNPTIENNMNFNKSLNLQTKSTKKLLDTCDLPNEDNSFVSGILNSDYDLLDELIDEDLRKEIGELSSDDESKTAAKVDFNNEDKSTHFKAKEISFFNEIQTKVCNQKVLLKPADDRSNTFISAAQITTLSANENKTRNSDIDFGQSQKSYRKDHYQQTRKPHILQNLQINKSFIKLNDNNKNKEEKPPTKSILILPPNVAIQPTNVLPVLQSQLRSPCAMVINTPCVTVLPSTQKEKTVKKPFVIGNTLISQINKRSLTSINSLTNFAQSTTWNHNSTQKYQNVSDQCAQMPETRLLSIDKESVNTQHSVKQQAKTENININCAKKVETLNSENDKKCQSDEIREQDIMQDTQTIFPQTKKSVVSQKTKIKNLLQNINLKKHNSKTILIKRKSNVNTMTAIKEKVKYLKQKNCLGLDKNKKQLVKPTKKIKVCISKKSKDIIPAIEVTVENTTTSLCEGKLLPSKCDILLKNRDEDRERLLKKRESIINRNINHNSFYPPIPLPYESLKDQFESQNKCCLSTAMVKSPQRKILLRSKKSDSHTELPLRWNTRFINPTLLKQSVSFPLKEETKNIAETSYHQPNTALQETIKNASNVPNLNIKSSIKTSTVNTNEAQLHQEREISNQANFNKNLKSPKDILNDKNMSHSSKQNSKLSSFGDIANKQIQQQEIKPNISRKKQVPRKAVSSNSKTYHKDVSEHLEIQELPFRQGNDPNKRIIRIKLPGGQSFKATIYGKAEVNIDTLFSDPAIKSLLNRDVTDVKRYTLNIKTVSSNCDNANKVIKTFVQGINVHNKPRFTPEETVSLISDDEEEVNNVTDTFNKKTNVSDGQSNTENTKKTIEKPKVTKEDKEKSEETKFDSEPLNHSKKVSCKSLNQTNSDIIKGSAKFPTESANKIDDSRVKCTESNSKTENCQRSANQNDTHFNNINIEKTNYHCPNFVEEAKEQVKEANAVLHSSTQDNIFLKGNGIKIDSDSNPPIHKTSVNPVLQKNIDPKLVPINLAQEIISQKNMLPDSDALVANNPIKDKAETICSEVIEIDDSSTDSVFKDDIENIHRDTNVLPTPAKIEQLKGLLLYDLGVESNDIKASLLVTQVSLEKTQVSLVKPCLIKLDKCDDLAKKYNIVKRKCHIHLEKCDLNRLNENTQQIECFKQNMTGNKLCRRGSFSLLSNAHFADIEQHVSSGRTSPVIEAYDIIAKLFKIKLERPNFACHAEWFMTKRLFVDKHIQMIYNCDTDASFDSDDDITVCSENSEHETVLDEIDNEMTIVPSLLTLVVKYFNVDTHFNDVISYHKLRNTTKTHLKRKRPQGFYVNSNMKMFKIGTHKITTSNNLNSFNSKNSESSMNNSFCNLSKLNINLIRSTKQESCGELIQNNVNKKELIDDKILNTGSCFYPETSKETNAGNLKSTVKNKDSYKQEDQSIKKRGYELHNSEINDTHTTSNIRSHQDKEIETSINESVFCNLRKDNVNKIQNMKQLNQCDSNEISQLSYKYTDKIESMTNEKLDEVTNKLENIKTIQPIELEDCSKNENFEDLEINSLNPSKETDTIRKVQSLMDISNEDTNHNIKHTHNCTSLQNTPQLSREEINSINVQKLSFYEPKTKKTDSENIKEIVTNKTDDSIKSLPKVLESKRCTHTCKDEDKNNKSLVKELNFETLSDDAEKLTKNVELKSEGQNSSLQCIENQNNIDNEVKCTDTASLNKKSILPAEMELCCLPTELIYNNNSVDHTIVNSSNALKNYAETTDIDAIESIEHSRSIPKLLSDHNNINHIGKIKIPDFKEVAIDHNENSTSKADVAISTSSLGFHNDESNQLVAIKNVQNINDTKSEKNTCMYKDRNGVLLKGIEYKDPNIGTCYVFPVSKIKSSISLEKKDVLSILIDENKYVNSDSEPFDVNRLVDEIPSLTKTEFAVNKPKITYSGFNRKRTRDMRDVKICEKKYRKSKNIDYPKLSVSAIEDSAYGKEFKRLFDYCSTLKFSYSRPFHKDTINHEVLVRDWPDLGKHTINQEYSTDNCHLLFEDIDDIKIDSEILNQTLASEMQEIGVISNEKLQDINETNFSMGFGEGSDRVTQNLINCGPSQYSAATLSDVKLQPSYLSKTSCNDENIKRCLSFIDMHNKVKSFFERNTLGLLAESIGSKDKRKGFPFDLCDTSYMEPLVNEVVVQVVQVGQQPVSAAAQNPVTCDPRVTQVSESSPSQCSVESSPQDESQSGIKTEYTELTTADLSLPLIHEYAQENILSFDSKDKDTTNTSLTEQNITIEMEIKPEVKIESEDIPSKEDVSNCENDEFQPFDNKTLVNQNFHTVKNDTSTCPETRHINSILFNSEEQPRQTNDLQQSNGSVEKTDQLADAMNAAGITTSNETNISNAKAQAFVNILSQKIRQASVSSGLTSSIFSKTTSLNAMTLQQALSQILPPPLNQTSNDNNHHIQNTGAPQVLHIVQNKNASGNQITLVDSSQQSGLNTSNGPPVLHIVQNKSGVVSSTNGASTQQPNFSGISLVDAGQCGNQLLHIVNTGNQKNTTGQLLKRVNLLTNIANVQGSTEQKMVQFVCKSADGKTIQLNAPHQRSMVLRLQPIESTIQSSINQKPIEPQDSTSGICSSGAKDNTASQQEIKSRSIYEENYAKFIQNSSSKPATAEKSTALPKFNQAFGKTVFQDGSQKNSDINSSSPLHSTSQDNNDCPNSENTINLEHISQINSPPLLLRKTTVPTSQAQTNLVQQLKQTITPMNIQTMHGGVIYTRQIPVNLGSGQTINLITVPSTELIDDSGQKGHQDLKYVNQSDIDQPSIIKIVPQGPPTSNQNLSTEGNNNNNNQSTESSGAHNLQGQPVLTQMRIKLPMLSKNPQMVPGTRVVRPSFFQIQRNVIGGPNQAVYQQLVLTAAPSLNQQTIRLPQAHTIRPIKVPPDNHNESQMSSSTLEQLREFDMVLEQVKERSTVQPNSNQPFKSSTDSTDGSNTIVNNNESSPQQVLYSIGNNQPINIAYVNRKPTTATPTTSTFVRSPDSSGIADSPSPSTHHQLPQTISSESLSNETSSQPKPAKVGSSKSKSRPKSSSNPPNTLKLNTLPPKSTAQKPLEDEQTTQRILYILAEYKEQVENSPDKDKPAPRRRSNPPSNPSGSSKRKKSSSSSRRPGMRDMSPVHGDDTCRTMGSEDSSCGTSQGDCNENGLESSSPQDSPRKVVRKLTFEQESLTTQPRPQLQPTRNVIVADGQTITVARGTSGKPTTAVLMPANYILPVSMVKGGQQIAIVTNRGPKLLTVGGEGGTTNALLLQRLIGPAGLKPVLARPGVRHLRLPTATLHNLQAFNLTTNSISTTNVPPSDSTSSPAPLPTPELVESKPISSPWNEQEAKQDVKPERSTSPEGSEPWNIPSSADTHEFSYEDSVRNDNMDRTVLDPIQDRYSPDMEAQRIFDKMFDIDTKKSYVVGSHDDSPQCGYDIESSDCEDKTYQVVQKKDGTTQRQHRLTNVTAAALRHKYAILEHELRLQKSLSEECSDLGVDSPSASDLFPEAELLFASSPAAHEHINDNPRSQSPPSSILNERVISQPDMEDHIATDQLLPRSEDMQDDRQSMDLGLEDVGMVTVSEDGMRATIALDQEEFARSHPNTTFHSEPTEGVEQPFTLTGIKGRHITSTIFHSSSATATVLVTAPPSTVIAQAPDRSVPGAVKYADLDKMMQAIPAARPDDLSLAAALAKGDGLARFDSILSDAAAPARSAAQVIRRLCYDKDARFLLDEPESPIAGRDAKMAADCSPRSAAGDGDDDRSSPERHAELFWESNSASERSDTRRALDFSSDSDKCCKSSDADADSSSDSGPPRSKDSSSNDDHPPLRTYPPKRLYRSAGKTRAGGSSPGSPRSPRSPRAHSPHRRRAVAKRGCLCCAGSPAPAHPRPKRPRHRKPADAPD